jgi:hypothetical protein
MEMGGNGNVATMQEEWRSCLGTARKRELWHSIMRVI